MTESKYTIGKTARDIGIARTLADNMARDAASGWTGSDVEKIEPVFSLQGLEINEAFMKVAFRAVSATLAWVASQRDNGIALDQFNSLGNAVMFDVVAGEIFARNNTAQGSEKGSL